MDLGKRSERGESGSFTRLAREVNFLLLSPLLSLSARELHVQGEIIVERKRFTVMGHSLKLLTFVISDPSARVVAEVTLKLQTLQFRKALLIALQLFPAKKHLI